MSRWPALLPELLLGLATAVTYAVMVVARQRRGRAARRALVAGASLAFLAAVATSGAADDFLFTAYRVDAFTQFAKALVLLGVLVAALLEWRDEGRWADERGTVPFFLGAGGMALLVVVSAGDLILLWLALEAASAALVLLVALGGRWATHQRAVRRLVAHGAALTVLGALGVTLVAVLAGTTKLVEVPAGLAGAAGRLAALSGAACLVLAVAGRLGVVPFHAWSVAVNRDAESGVAAFAATAVWAAAAAAGLRVAAATGAPLAGLSTLLFAIGVAAMAVGVRTAFPMRDLRRTLAGSAALQAGFVLAGIAVRTPEGGGAALGGAAATVLAQVVGFTAVAHLGRPGGEPGDFDLRGLWRRSPLLAAALLVALFSLAGAPPTAGFTWKWRVLAAMWDEGYRALAVAAASLAVAAVAGTAIAAGRMRGPPDAAQPALVHGRLERVGLVAVAALLLALVWGSAPPWTWAASAAAQLP